MADTASSMMMASDTSDNLFFLPLEVVSYIFSFLNTPELLQCAPLCSYVHDGMTIIFCMQSPNNILVVLKQPIVWKYLNFRFVFITNTTNYNILTKYCRSIGIVFPLHLKSVLERTSKNNVALLRHAD